MSTALRSVLKLQRCFSAQFRPISQFRVYARSQPVTVFVVKINFRNFSAKRPLEERGFSKTSIKMRRAYALGGCLFFMWISMHGLLYWRRSSEVEALDLKLPPISWDEFKNTQIPTGKVKLIVFQPQFDVANVYLEQEKQVTKKNAFSELLNRAPDKYARPPDVRFYHRATGEEMQAEIQAVCDQLKQNIEFEIDEFPSYRELGFIVLSSVFVLSVLSLPK